MIFAFLSFFLSMAHAEWDFQGKAEVGARSRTYHDRAQTFYSPLVSGDIDGAYSGEAAQYKFNFGGKLYQLDQLEGEPTGAFVGMAAKGLSIKLGYQTVSWGQSFAFLIADLVNPKDLRDPLTTDPAWINLATPMANVEYFFNGGGLQFVLTPVPRNNKYLRTGRESDIFEPGTPVPATADPDNFGNSSLSDGEYGLRINKVIKGVEISLFGIHHWNRTALYQVVLEGGTLVLKPTRYQTDSYGLGFSYDLNEQIEGMVFRGDVVYHTLHRRASTTYLTTTDGPSTDWAVGLDWTFEFGIDTAIQWIGHKDAADKDELGSIKLSEKFFKETLEIGATVVWGLQRDQTWFKPHITWFPVKNLEFMVVHDLVDADPKEAMATLRSLTKQDRTQVSLKYLF